VRLARQLEVVVVKGFQEKGWCDQWCSHWVLLGQEGSWCCRMNRNQQQQRRQRRLIKQQRRQQRAQLHTRVALWRSLQPSPH
jgi:hypothetical protein